MVFPEQQLLFDTFSGATTYKNAQHVTLPLLNVLVVYYSLLLSLNECTMVTIIGVRFNMLIRLSVQIYQ